MLDGLAEKLLMTGLAGAAVTVTCAVAVLFPLLLLAVKVYVIVVEGLTFTEPVAPVTVPTLLLILMVVALLTFQESVLLNPLVIVLGFATKLLITGPFLGLDVMAGKPEKSKQCTQKR